jgi:hypothetical protein
MYTYDVAKPGVSHSEIVLYCQQQKPVSICAPVSEAVLADRLFRVIQLSADSGIEVASN